MIWRSLWLPVAILLPYVFADVEFTSPEPGDSIKAGGAISIKWKDSGDSPPLDDLLSYQIFLCAGGNKEDSFLDLKPLVPSGKFSTGATASATVEAGLGESVKNAYFIKMISTAPGGTVINYSGRFSLSGMTGKFPPAVTTGLKSVTGTDGPPTENSVQKVKPGAGDAVGAESDFAVPYTMQTGAMRYAPMAEHPPQKITAKDPKPLYPTSAVQLAAEKMPTPVQQTTITQSNTFSVQSMENTVAGQGQPTDNAMQKFLNRWKD